MNRPPGLRDGRGRASVALRSTVSNCARNAGRADWSFTPTPSDRTMPATSATSAVRAASTSVAVISGSSFHTLSRKVWKMLTKGRSGPSASDPWILRPLPAAIRAARGSTSVRFRRPLRHGEATTAHAFTAHDEESAPAERSVGAPERQRRSSPPYPAITTTTSRSGSSLAACYLTGIRPWAGSPSPSTAGPPGRPTHLAGPAVVAWEPDPHRAQPFTHGLFPQLFALVQLVRGRRHGRSEYDTATVIGTASTSLRWATASMFHAVRSVIRVSLNLTH